MSSAIRLRVCLRIPRVIRFFSPVLLDGFFLPAVGASGTITLNLGVPEYHSCGDVSINGVVLMDGGNITRLSWNWGDGVTVDSWFPASHTYKQNGSDPVQVIAYANTGETKSAAISVNINNAEDVLCGYSVRVLPETVVLRAGKTSENLQVDIWRAGRKENCFTRPGCRILEQ